MKFSKLYLGLTGIALFCFIIGLIFNSLIIVLLGWGCIILSWIFRFYVYKRYKARRGGIIGSESPAERYKNEYIDLEFPFRKFIAWLKR